MAKRERDRDSDEDLVEDLRKHLEIDKHSLDTELQQQASTFFKIGEATVLAGAKRDFCKENIKRVDAELSSKHRRKMEKSGTRPTDAAVLAAIQGDPEHQKAVDAHLKATTKADLLSALKEAFHQRSYMVRDLASLYMASYYERETVGDTNKVREVKADKAIDRMAEERKRRIKEKE